MTRPTGSPRNTTIADDHIGMRIRAARMSRGMSQTDLADYVGISFQQVQKYEKGTNKVAASRLGVIAKALKISVTELLGGDSKDNIILINPQVYKLAQSLQRLHDLSPKVALRFRNAIDATCDALNSKK